MVKDVEPEAQSDVKITPALEAGADVVIDFSSPDGTRPPSLSPSSCFSSRFLTKSQPSGTRVIAKRAEELKIALVIGTTAKDFEWRADFKKSSEKV
jgi:dihydrodipicolinate reductase